MRAAEFAVIGAGPAGMAAAIRAAELGLDTILIDDQRAPGGQIYRAVERAGADSPLGPDYLAGRELVAALRASAVEYRPATSLWHLDPEGRLFLAAGERCEVVSARRVLLATGAIERPVPIPGWTLPGVMTVGAAQTLLKTADLVPTGRVVLAGQGPLLYLAASQLVRAAAPPGLILDTTAPADYRRCLSALRRGRPRPRMLLAGLAAIAAIKRAGIQVRHGVRGLRALGAGALERVAWEGGETGADHLFVHQGLIPNLQISLALQLRHEWNDDQLCWQPVLDPWGQTSLPGIAVAGDGGRILGAAAARLSGELAALDAAMMLGRITGPDRDRQAEPIRAALGREQALRGFLDRLYRPAPAILAPAEDDTIVCRCENVSAGAIRRAVRQGAPGPNQVKAFTRCGMGPCQGRICAGVVAALIAESLGRSPGQIELWRPRAPYKPITVAALANLAVAE
jgi:NADPH-dependent 2,4-dienoyl-CoA reductase/sulfur reductase-like enzyme